MIFFAVMVRSPIYPSYMETVCGRIYSWTAFSRSVDEYLIPFESWSPSAKCSKGHSPLHNDY
jgi:hypothetical protein